MHLEIFVEERSAEVAVRCLIPRILGSEVSFEVYTHQGKAALLADLPSRLRAYARWLPEDWRILVLVDADSQNCRELKRQLDEIARAAGLRPKADVGGWTGLQVLNRLAIEELEA